MAGINEILQRIAKSGAKAEKQAFVPMPGGMPATDPMAGGMPPTGPMAGGMPPMDSTAGGMPPMGPGGQADPMMAAAAGGMPPAEIMAAQGMPVDPMMADAGGAAGIPPEAAPGGPSPVDPAIQAAIDEAVTKATAGGGGGGASKGGAKANLESKIDRIEAMLNKVVGVLVGQGRLSGGDLRDMQEPAPEPGIPAEQKVASMGGPVQDQEQKAAGRNVGLSAAKQLAKAIVALNE